MTKAALVLSGGSIKGAYQAGAVAELLRRGVQPEGIFGISTGALNASFLADRAGRHLSESGRINWPAVGNDLVAFWENNVRSPSDLVHKRGGVSVGWSIVRGKFDGLVDPSPLQKILKREIKRSNIERFANSGSYFSVGAVDVYAGQIIYGDHTQPNIEDFVFASAAIPIAFPVVPIQYSRLNDPFVDGGIRDIVPLQRAVKKGYEKLFVVLCQPPGYIGSVYNTGNIIKHIDRIIDVMLSEIIDNDIENISIISKLSNGCNAKKIKELKMGIFKNLKEPYLVRPDAMDPILDVDITDFTHEHIIAMLDKGKRTVERNPPAV